MAAIPQRSRCPWATKVIDRQTFTPPTTSANHMLAITRVFLVNPASAAGLGIVVACIKIGKLRHTLASLSAESPSAELPEPFVVDQEFTLYVPGGHCYPSDDGWSVFQAEGYKYLRQECDEGEADHGTNQDGAQNEAEASNPENDELISVDEDDTDNEDDKYSTEEEEEEEEDSHGEIDGQEAMASSAGDDVTSNFAVPDGKFVGGPTPRFASAGSTAGFMRVAAVESQEEGDRGDKQMSVSVLYRCTLFSAASGGGVRVRESTMTNHLRFVVPPAGDTARSLQCVGAILAPLVYPVRYRKRLRTLWSRLIAEVSVPARAVRVEVVADVGILRTFDRTPERMERMRAVLEGMVPENIQQELQLEIELPECGLGENCAICFEVPEADDLATWPGCSKPHVFHGACLELVLKSSDKCPLCRNVWSIDRASRDAEVDGQAAALRTAGSNAITVRQAVARMFFGLLLFVCMILCFRFMV